MSDAIFVQDGNSIDYTPEAAVTGGDIVIQGDLIGVAKSDIAAAALGSLATVGVFDLTKASGDGVAFAIGADVFWDADNSTAVATSAGRWLGVCVATAADADTTVRTRLNPGGDLPTAAHVGDVAAITAAAAALTAANPTADAAAITATDPTLDASDITDSSAGTASETHVMVALADGSTYANDVAALRNNLATIAAEYNSLKDDTEAIETSLEKAIDDVTSVRAATVANNTSIEAVVADMITQKAELDKLIADVTLDKTKINAILTALEGLGLFASA